MAKFAKLPVLGEFAEGCLMLGFFIVGMAMIWFGFSGNIDFGNNSINSIIYMIVAIALISGSQFFVNSSLKTRVWTTISLFVACTIGLIVLGTVMGIFSAVDSGTVFSGYNMFIAFDVNMVASGDIGMGLNAKLIADSICTLIPSFTLVIIIFQLLYSDGTGEFIKALIEGFAIILFFIAYSIVGGVPVSL